MKRIWHMIYRRRKMRSTLLILGFIIGLTFTSCFNYVYIPKLGIYYPNEVQLEIQCNKTKVSLNETVFFDVKIKNYTRDSFYFVFPGDGSYARYRVPIIQWSVIKMNKKSEHPVDIVMVKDTSRIRFCGNISSLKEKEIIILKPRYIASLNWVYYPIIPQEIGKYSVRFYYKNDPQMDWKNEPYMTKKELQLVRFIRDNTESLSLISNELIIEVVE